MDRGRKKLRIGIYFDNHGGHVASWKMPGVDPQDVVRPAYWKNLARLSEQARLDYLFFADSNRVQYQRNPKAMQQMPATPHFEPMTMLGMMSAVTEHIGLAATMTTTYTQPYTVARLFGSLDIISEGRASWNVVTSASGDEAPNFQAQPHAPHDERYVRAHEFLKIVLGLWDSWEDDAFPRDQATGQYLVHAKMHPLNYKSDMFSVKGPLNLPRSPQGHPVIFQAGSSGIGRDFGAEMADALFTAQETKEGAIAFYNDVRARIARFGRNPDHVKIFVGNSPIIGRTRDEAQAKFDLLQSKLTPDVSLQLLTEVIGIDVSGMPPDELVTELPPSNGMQSRRDLMLDKAIKEKLTLLQLAEFVAGGRGHRQIIGTPQSIADDFEDWFESGAMDGLLLAPAFLPGAVEDIAHLLIPELQRRGLFRTEYEGKTLRENLGIPRPPHPAARKRG